MFASTEKGISSPGEDLVDIREMTSIHEKMNALQDKTTENTEKVSLIQKDLELLRQSLHGPSIIENGEKKTLAETVRFGVVGSGLTAQRSRHSIFVSSTSSSSSSSSSLSEESLSFDF